VLQHHDLLGLGPQGVLRVLHDQRPCESAQQMDVTRPVRVSVLPVGARVVRGEDRLGPGHGVTAGATRKERGVHVVL